MVPNCARRAVHELRVPAISCCDLENLLCAGEGCRAWLGEITFALLSGLSDQSDKLRKQAPVEPLPL